MIDIAPDPCVVRRVEVDGFWKSRRLEWHLQRDINFVIGPNGAGKTTVVNLLAAALTADFRALDRIDFSAINVYLGPADEPGAKYRLSVLKDKKKDLPFAPIDIILENADGVRINAFSLDEVEEQILLRDARYYSKRRGLMRSRVIADQLGSLVDVSWLSVQRHDGSGDRPDNPGESAIDLKIESQSNQLVRFFSRLEQQAVEVLNTFQQSVFISLLLGHEQGVGFWSTRELDRDSERKRIVPILEDFGVQKSRYGGRLDKHLEAVREATSKLNKHDGLEDKDVVSLVNQKRISEVVSEWESYQLKKSMIYRLRDTFISTLNSMLLGKQVYISSTNELAVRSLNGGALPVKSLSSGEKQLLIILGQALLQDSRPVIYIADEPELSLHVAWQEKIVDAIRGINPVAQIIFATHSPDIVGSYQDRVRDARELFVQ